MLNKAGYNIVPWGTPILIFIRLLALQISFSLGTVASY